MINFDFLLAGCNTRCQHCYVNGGPGPLMPVEDVLLCIDKLDEMAEYLPTGASFTLDHEPMNHPYIDQIIYAASKTKHIQNFHHGMTTGVGLMHRKDKEAVVRAYLDCGYDEFGITLHGSPRHHDEIVRRQGAFETAVAAAEFLKSRGAKINVSLMLNRYFPEDADVLSRVAEQLLPTDIWLAIPIFTPHKNMIDFEPHRATLHTVESLRGYLTEWKQSEDEILQKARNNTIAAAIAKIKQGIDLRERFTQKQDELYMTIHQDCKLYVGNSGGEVCCLGDLRQIDVKETAQIINELPGNRDYGAYYDVEAIPCSDVIIAVLEKLPQDLVYGDFESILYRGFTELGIPTLIL